HATLEAFTEKVKSESNFSAAAEKLSSINKRMSRDFTRSYKDAQEIKISSNGEEKITFISCFIDGIRNRIAYDKKGNWHSTLRFYDEDAMPKDVRHLVKSNYYDYAINGVTEVKFNNKLAYVISLEGKTDWKKVKVVDGEMEVMEAFKKL
ncbi:MAG TPA: hypothetical protein VM012_13795, partial [Flavitalea sp.]|nr:hypothetical protein [Flavitalea sp.]